MKVISGRTKVIVTLEDIKGLVANCITMSKSDFDLEISDLSSGKSDLWYPDDSGKWVEVDPKSTTMPLELHVCTQIEVLCKYERDEMIYSEYINLARTVMWNNNPSSNARIVAYKIVK